MEPTELELFKNRLGTIFLEYLSRKSGWGKNEVYQEFKTAMKDAEIEMLRDKFEKVSK